jgi:hypothetical protein
MRNLSRNLAETPCNRPTNLSYHTDMILEQTSEFGVLLAPLCATDLLKHAAPVKVHSVYVCETR